MIKTLDAVVVARKARKRTRLKFQAETRTSVFSEGELAENESNKMTGKMDAPLSFQIDFDTNEGKTSLYSHNRETYSVMNGEVEKLGQEDNQALLHDLNLEQIAKNDFERLMIYAEEMDFTTVGTHTTISLPADAENSEFVKEFAQDIEKQDASLTVKKMHYALTFDENFELVSFYTCKEIGLKDEVADAFKLVTEVNAQYFPLDEHEDFSIPPHILEAAK